MKHASTWHPCQPASATMPGGGLVIDVDEEGDMLVENAGAASLFSPGMWVQRPQRTPAADAAAAHDDKMADMAAEEQHRCVCVCLGCGADQVGRLPALHTKPVASQSAGAFLYSGCPGCCHTPAWDCAGLIACILA